MAAIGQITHLPDIKAKKCVQCGEWFYYQRITAKCCDAACRKQASRGVPADDKNPHVLTDYEQLVAIIAEHQPRAFRRLERLRDKFGERGVLMCLDVIMAMGTN